tara:strand:+ start:461 stop:643 length:183 start_codon:yes stop_codon:yes gene_type:complete
MSATRVPICTHQWRRSEMGLLRTLAGAAIGGAVGGPLGAIAGAAIANDPSADWGEFQHDE